MLDDSIIPIDPKELQLSINSCYLVRCHVLRLYARQNVKVKGNAKQIAR